MNQSHLSDGIQRHIKKEELRPLPHIYFVLKNNAWVALVATAIIFSAFALASIYFIFTEHDWAIVEYSGRSIFMHFISALPYLWIVVTIGLIVGSFYSVRRVKYGYRYKAMAIVILSFLFSILIGAIIIAVRFDHVLNNTLMSHMPFYEKLVYTKEDMWMHPEQGLLSGVISEQLSEYTFKLLDLDNKEWFVRTTNDTRFDNGVEIAPMVAVKIIGEKQDANVFEAIVVRPWGR